MNRIDKYSIGQVAALGVFLTIFLVAQHYHSLPFMLAIGVFGNFVGGYLLGRKMEIERGSK